MKANQIDDLAYWIGLNDGTNAATLDRDCNLVRTNPTYSRTTPGGQTSMRTGYLLADLPGSRSSWASKVKYRAVRRPLLAGFRSLSRRTRRLPQPRLIPAKVKTNAAQVSVQEVLRLIILPVMNLGTCVRWTSSVLVVLLRSDKQGFAVRNARKV